MYGAMQRAALGRETLARPSRITAASGSYSLKSFLFWLNLL
jgi:hypothetical protein